MPKAFAPGTLRYFPYRHPIHLLLAHSLRLVHYFPLNLNIGNQVFVVSLLLSYLYFPEGARKPTVVPEKFAEQLLL